MDTNTQSVAPTNTYDYAYFQQYMISLMTLEYILTGIVYIFIILLLVKGGLFLWNRMSHKTDTGKINYLLIAILNFLLTKAHNSGTHKHIFTTGKFRIKSRAQFQQRRDSTLYRDFAGGGSQGSAK